MQQPVAGAGGAVGRAAGGVCVALAGAVAHRVITVGRNVSTRQFRPRQPREGVVLVLLGQTGIHAVGDCGDAICCVEAVGQALQRCGVAGSDPRDAAIGVVVGVVPQTVAVWQGGGRAERLIADEAGHGRGRAVHRILLPHLFARSSPYWLMR